MKILLSGGGTLGPVTPLLAMVEIFRTKYPEAEFLWVATEKGPEIEIVSTYKIKTVVIASGKLRRYLSLWNIFDLIKIAIGFFQSLRLLWCFNPEVVISAGAFVSVPLHYAAWWMGIPTWIHQQDAQIGLANRLMSPIAKRITVALEETGYHFARRKTRWLGNPVRQDLFLGNFVSARLKFNLTTNLPVVFVTGGGTGSLRVNQLVVEALPHLDGFCEIIHLSGRERPQELTDHANQHFSWYHAYQFFTTEMKDAYAVADIIISRAGFGTMSEIAALGKPAIFIPKPGHQEQNARSLEHENAALVLHEKTTTGLSLAKAVRTLIENKSAAAQMGVTFQKILPPARPADILQILNECLDS